MSMRAPVLAVVLLLASACSQAGGDLEAAQDRWEAEGVKDYTVDVRMLCECPAGTYRVEVRDGRQSGIKALDEGNQRAAGDLRLTVDDLFGRVRDEMDAHRLQVEYDPQFGYPLKIEIDRERRTVDDEVTYLVTRYEPSDPGPR